MATMDEKARQANRERQQKYRELHREEINEKRRVRYNDRISDGKCPRCGSKVKKGYTLCTKCCEYQADLNKKYAKERKDAAPRTAAAKPKAVPKAKAAAKPKAAPKAKVAAKPKATPKAKAAAKPKAAPKAKAAAKSKAAPKAKPAARTKAKK